MMCPTKRPGGIGLASRVNTATDAGGSRRVLTDGGDSIDSVTDRLSISGSAAAGDHRQYRERGINAVVQLTHSEPEGGYPAGVAVHQHAMVDGPRNDAGTLQRAVARTVVLVCDEKHVLVHCSAGASRSVAVAGAALAVLDGEPTGAAVERVASARGAVNVHPAVLANAGRAVADLRGEASGGDAPGDG